jgi:hypothetical protein
LTNRLLPATAPALGFAEMALARAFIAMMALILTAPALADVNSTITSGARTATTCYHQSSTTLTCNSIPGTRAGDILLFYGAAGAVTTVTAPTGFTQAIQQQGNGWTANVFWKVATSSEPASYTITYSGSNSGDGVLFDIRNASSSAIDATSAVSVANGPIYTIPAPSTNGIFDLNIACGTNVDPQTLTSPAGTAGPISTANYTTCWYYSGSGSSVAVTGGGSGAAIAIQTSIAPRQVSTGTNIATPAILNQPAGFSANVAFGTPPYSPAANPMTGYSTDGCFNPIAYGADPTGVIDSSAAFNATTAAACAAQGQVCLSPGSYLFAIQPWLHQCSSGLVPNIKGAGRGAVTLLNKIGTSYSLGGGPALEISSTLVAGDLAANGPIEPALVGTGNSWNNSSAHPFLFDLNYPLSSAGLSGYSGLQPLNGLPAFTVETCFNTTTNSVEEMLAASDGSATPAATVCGYYAGFYTCRGAFFFGLDSAGKLTGAMNIGGTWTGRMTSSSAVGTNTTICAQMSYDGSNVRLFHGAPGATMTEDAKVAATGTVTERPDEDLTMLMQSRQWHLLYPAYPWQGQVDTFRISKVARCTNDSGCTAPNAKLSGDSNTVFLENWTNVNSLPLVGPEYTNGNANVFGGVRGTSGMQSWMVAEDETSGNPGDNHPNISGFSIVGGSVGIHINVVAPQLRDVAAGNTSGAVIYGFLSTKPSNYGTIGRDLWANSSVAGIFNSGLTYLYGLNFTASMTAGEFAGPEVSGLSILTSSGELFGAEFNGAVANGFYDDAESGGNYPSVLVAGNANPVGTSFQCNSCQIYQQGTAAPVVLDGSAPLVTISNSWLNPAGTGGIWVDATHASTKPTITFNNDSTLGGHICPTGAYTNNSAYYTVNGGCTLQQTTLNGTTAGTAVSSEPIISSNRKVFDIYLNGYENTTATAQTISIPVAFATSIGAVSTVSGTCTGVTATTSAITLPSSMGATQTGLCEFDGY